MDPRESALQDLLQALPVALFFSPFHSVKGIFPHVTAVVETLLTQTPNCLMNPKDPQGMLKALHGSHGTRFNSSVCLRALFQLFLMYSGAQTARPTWPKWNHSILSTLPMEPQQQILPGKSRLSVFQPIRVHWHCSKSRNLCYLLQYWLLFLCHWYVVSCVDTLLISWKCNFNRNIANYCLW